MQTAQNAAELVAVAPSGSEQQLALNYQATNKDEQAAEQAEPTFVSELTFPNVAYGQRPTRA